MLRQGSNERLHFKSSTYENCTGSIVTSGIIRTRAAGPAFHLVHYFRIAVSATDNLNNDAATTRAHLLRLQHRAGRWLKAAQCQLGVNYQPV